MTSMLIARYVIMGHSSIPSQDYFALLCYKTCVIVKVWVLTVDISQAKR